MSSWCVSYQQALLWLSEDSAPWTCCAPHFTAHSHKPNWLIWCLPALNVKITNKNKLFVKPDLFKHDKFTMFSENELFHGSKNSKMDNFVDKKFTIWSDSFSQIRQKTPWFLTTKITINSLSVSHSELMRVLIIEW